MASPFLTAAVLLVTCACFVQAKTVRNETISYEGFQTHMVMPETEAQVAALMTLSHMPGVDFWTVPSKIAPATVMVAPDAEAKFSKVLKTNHIAYNTTWPDVARTLAKEKRLQEATSGGGRRRMGGGGSSYLNKYLRYSEMIQLLKSLAKQHKNVARLEVIGTSFEGRPIYMMKMSSDFSAQKGVAMIEAGIHAREWAAPAMALHVIHEVLAHQPLLDSQDWHVIPSANPDGYEYTHTKDRLWRKTRSMNRENGDCVGVDGNRNFDTHWAEVGSSNNPCSEIYHGHSAFSEVETRAIRDAAYRDRHRMRVFLSVHSFGSLILYPYGHTKTLVPEWGELDACGRRAATEIRSYSGPDFTVGNTANVLYPSGAGSDDYMKMKFKTPYAYTIELPGGGKDGFDLPPTEINKMVHEVFPGIVILSLCWQE